MGVVVLYPLRQCRDASLEEFASVWTRAHIKMWRLFKPAAIGELSCWRLTPSMQHFAGTAVPRALLAIPELVHLGSLVESGTNILSCDEVEGIIIHEVQPSIEFLGGLSTDVEPQVLCDVRSLLDIVYEHADIFQGQYEPLCRAGRLHHCLADSGLYKVITAPAQLRFNREG